jgi:hypothetical protein
LRVACHAQRQAAGEHEDLRSYLVPVIPRVGACGIDTAFTLSAAFATARSAERFQRLGRLPGSKAGVVRRLRRVCTCFVDPIEIAWQALPDVDLEVGEYGCAPGSLLH